jgi:hypothetical protein
MKKTIGAALAAGLWPFAASAGHAQEAPPMLVVPPPPPIVMPMPPAPPMPSAPASLRDSFVYIYNFLDVRTEQYGDKVLAEFDQQLIRALDLVHSGSKVLRYRNSPAMQSSGSKFGSTMIPVGDTVYANLADETAVGAKYRLIVFPTAYTLSGAWRFYEVRWTLMDVRTGRKVWSYLYSGKHLVLLRTNENAAKRGEKLIKAAFDDLGRAGLL